MEMKTTYIGDVTFNDLKATGNLYEVCNAPRQGSVYFYFSPEAVKNFDGLNDISQEKFCRLVKEGDIKFTAAKNDQGIKYLGEKENLPKCNLQINQKYCQSKMSYELKVMGTPDRLGVVCIKPQGDGPQILVATHAIKAGIHDNKHNGKQLTSKKFLIPLNKEATAKSMQTFGIFGGQNKSDKQSKKPRQALKL